MLFESLLFISIFLVLIGMPCLGIGIIGVKMMNRLGRWPSKTPAIQMEILIKLVVVEVVALAMMLIFYRLFIG